jgi:hypothetical protein
MAAGERAGVLRDQPLRAAPGRHDRQDSPVADHVRESDAG